MTSAEIKSYLNMVDQKVKYYQKLLNNGMARDNISELTDLNRMSRQTLAYFKSYSQYLKVYKLLENYNINN